MMSYNEEYKKSMEVYKQLMEEYTAITSSEKYKEVCDTMPFDFLQANQKTETLKMFQEVEGNMKFNFKRAEDAISFMYGFVDVRKGMDAILDGASYIASAEKKAIEINELVEKSPYLPSNLKVSTDNFIFGVARECLEVLPNYPSLLNYKFKKAFVENCVETLSTTGLQKLVDVKMIAENDIKIVKVSGSKEYKEKMNALREMLGNAPVYYENHNIKVNGTSFKNKDNVERQSLLAQLKDSDNKELTVNKGTWSPSPGVEKNMVEIKWEGQIIGFVPQGTVDEMFAKYDDPEFEVTFKEVTGGGDVSYGCNVELSIIAKEYLKTEEKEEQKVK